MTDQAVQIIITVVVGQEKQELHKCQGNLEMS